MNYTEIVSFHGHECPGLAMGYRMSLTAMEKLESTRSEDEEIVAIVENDACGVDALQCITGCTFGKGNLIFHDYGKHAYTLFSRSTGQGVRVFFHGDGAPENIRENREEFAKWILSAPIDQMLTVESVSISEPDPARIHESVPCSSCGEKVMSSRIQELNGKPYCIPCYQKLN